MPEEQQRDKTVDLAPWWVVTGRALRFVLGALSLVGGLTWILLNLHVSTAALDAGVGAVFAAGGLVLLMPHRIRLPRLVTALVMSGFALAGTAAGLVAESSRECCMFAYISERGWPFHWVSRGGVADDPETAFRLAQSSGWSADLVSLATNLLVWSYAGLVLVVIAVLVRRARPVRAEEVESPVM